MSKHTPGPFEIRIAGKDPKPCVFTAASPSEPLGRAVARFERIEDAQAFVALPDLLSALQNLVGLFQSLHPNHANWGDYKAALAAIARAVGPASQATGGDHE